MTITNDEAFAAVVGLFEKEKFLVGPSSGAVYVAMEKLSLAKGCVVGIFADDGSKFKSLYSQQKVFTEEQFDKALKEALYLSQASIL